MKRAVEYDRLMKLEANPTRQVVFGFMRDMWIELANEASMGAQDLAGKLAAIEQIRRRV